MFTTRLPAPIDRNPQARRCRRRRPLPAKSHMAALASAIAACTITACTGTASLQPTHSTPTPIAISQLADHAATADHALAQAQPVIEGLTPESVPTDKPTVRMLIQQARGELATVATTAPQVIRQSTHDEKLTAHVQQENQRLRQADPARTWLTRLGILALAAGCGLLALSLWKFSSLLDYALITLLTGAALVTLARFLAQVELAIAIATGVTLLAIVIRIALVYRKQAATLLQAAKPKTP